MSPPFRFVCATRMTQEDFFAKAALGRSLAHYAGQVPVQLQLFPSNTTGLPAVYNQALRESAANPAILLFAHDDIYLGDYFWPARVLEGLAAHDILGVAGNRRRVANQPSWAFDDMRFAWDGADDRSGIVGHGRPFPDCRLTVYGEPNQEVKLLDGVLLIARSETLLSKGIQFDERFEFHFYDLDFCRQAEQNRLTMATCAISLVHESPGKAKTAAWMEGYSRYIAKWGS